MGLGLRVWRKASRACPGRILRRIEERGEVRTLGLPFLDAVFAEQALAGGVGFEDRAGGMDFANGHESDGFGGTVGAGAGVGDLIVEVLQI